MYQQLMIPLQFLIIFITGSKITYSNGSGTDITGLSNNTDYYAIVIDANTINLQVLSKRNSNTSISLTGTGNNNKLLQGCYW